MNFWAMKSYKSFLGYFNEIEQIGIEEDGVEYDYTIMEEIFEEHIVSKFNRFCKYINVNDYIFLGYGEEKKFRLKMICKVAGDYKFDLIDEVCRHKRDIKILKNFDTEIELKELSSIMDIECIEKREAIDILISRCL